MSLYFGILNIYNFEILRLGVGKMLWRLKKDIRHVEFESEKKNK